MLYRILNYIKNFLLVSVPDRDKKDFAMSISRINVTRAKITAITFIILEVMQLAVSYLIKGDIFLKKPDVYYGAMYILMLTIMAAFLFVFIKLEKNIPKNERSIRITGVLFTVFILSWCAGISLLDQLSSGQIIVYSIAVIATAVTPFYKPRALLLMYLPTYAVLLVLLPYFQESSEMIFGNYINSTTFLIFSWVIACMRYKNQVEDYNNRKIIQEKNNELKILNKKLGIANHQLEKLSRTDSLTGIANRYMFDIILKTEWDNCKRNFIPLSLIMIDIDFFKAFNDNYGHLAGDDCIKEVARVLSECARRSSDIVTRYGGDEFAIILPNMEKDRVLEFAELVRRSVDGIAIPHAYSETSKYLTISLGVYTTIPSEQFTIGEFISTADKALYEAKNDRRKSITSA